LKALDVDVNKIIVIDLSDYRLSIAKKLGADAVINAKSTNPFTKVMELVGSAPLLQASAIKMPKVDIVYDCVGYMKEHKGPLVLQQAINMVRGSTGTIVVHGIFEDKVSLDLLFMVGKEVTIKGSFAFTRIELEKSLKLIQNKKIDRSQIISHEFSLDKAKEAFETQCNADESLKVLIKP
jgi:threonine dehydrogenase-like Zn-dependent dehydrogenase